MITDLIYVSDKVSFLRRMIKVLLII